MPPVSPPSDQNNSLDDYPPLTNQGAYSSCSLSGAAANSDRVDVELLYNILISAEQHPDIETLPFRAIFAAYDEVLAQQGLDPNHDQVYLRFLFRLGDKKLPGQSLYESFDSLLEELGIRLEFTAGEDGILDITRSVVGGDVTEFESGKQSNGESARRNPSRRASFHSLYDAENETSRANRSRVHSRSSSSQRQHGQRQPPRERPATRASTRPTEKTHERPPVSRPPAMPPRGGRLTAQEFASNLQHYKRRNASASGNGDRGTQTLTMATEHQESPPDRNHGTISDTGSPLAPLDSVRNEIEPTETTERAQLSFVLDPRELLYRPSETQLFRDAETFQHYRVNAVARDALKKWNSAVLQAKQVQKEMDALAVKYDDGILMRQGFDHWRARLHEKREVAETEKFFNQLERRAGKARDLFLLSKAFTHWAQCTHDEALRTSTARGQILRLRYFNAWREITVVNELKVRHQGLRKFYKIWKQRFIGNQVEEVNAFSEYEEVLLKTVYWRWFWTFCERRAPQWRAARLKAKYLSLWARGAQETAEREHQIYEALHKKIKMSVLMRWLKKTRVILSNSQQAVSLSAHNLAIRSLREWQLGRQHAPLVQRVSNMVDWRVAGTTFATFVTRYRVERHAQAVNRLRTIRNAWTHWNDRLRQQTLAQKIGDRLVLEALYKWVIAERTVLLQRVNGQRLKRRMLLKFASRICNIKAQRNQKFQVFMRGRDQKGLCSAMATWRRQLDLHRQDERTALEFYSPRIAQEALKVWNTRSAQVQKLKGWAENATFYFMASKFLKRWRTAVVESKRKKRHNAYAHMRRKLKMDLATEVISRWRRLAVHMIEVNQHAQLANQKRLLQYGSGLFDVWKSRWESAVDRHRQADDHYRKKILERYLHVWEEQQQAHQEGEEQAQQYAQLRIESVAFGWLHKSRLQMIELQGRSRTADSLRGLYDKRHIHNLLRHWRMKTATKRGSLPTDRTLSSRSKRFGLRTEGEDITGRAEDWTAFEEGFDLGDWVPGLESNTTPLPGYLSTPSKRAARAKALAKGSTTPFGTPSQRRPRHPPNTEPRTGRRQGGLERSVAFGPITEHEPKTPTS
ncbi:hypothetical protein MMC07_005602 [Pseudocyphellaria aurata]|nr:hypothetical protein [Pseudocyphellaria aurata]